MHAVAVKSRACKQVKWAQCRCRRTPAVLSDLLVNRAFDRDIMSMSGLLNRAFDRDIMALLLNRAINRDIMSMTAGSGRKIQKNVHIFYLRYFFSGISVIQLFSSGKIFERILTMSGHY